MKTFINDSSENALMLAEELGIVKNLMDLFTPFYLDLDIAVVALAPDGEEEILRTSRQYYEDLCDILEKEQKLSDRNDFKERPDRLWEFGIFDRFKLVLRPGEPGFRQPDKYTLSQYGREVFYHLANLALKVFGEEDIGLSPQEFFGRQSGAKHNRILVRPEILLALYQNNFLNSESPLKTIELTNNEIASKIGLTRRGYVQTNVNFLEEMGLVKPEANSPVKVYRVVKDLNPYFGGRWVSEHRHCLLRLQQSYQKGNFRQGYEFKLSEFVEKLEEEGEKKVRLHSAMVLTKILVRQGYLKIEEETRKSSKVGLTDKAKKIAEGFLIPSYKLALNPLEINQISAVGTRYFLQNPTKRISYLKRILI